MLCWVRGSVPSSPPPNVLSALELLTPAQVVIAGLHVVCMVRSLDLSHNSLSGGVPSELFSLFSAALQCVRRTGCTFAHPPPPFPPQQRAPHCLPCDSSFFPSLCARLGPLHVWWYSFLLPPPLLCRSQDTGPLHELVERKPCAGPSAGTWGRQLHYGGLPLVPCLPDSAHSVWAFADSPLTAVCHFPFVFPLACLSPFPLQAISLVALYPPS
jgi:hypothetical protein